MRVRIHPVEAQEGEVLRQSANSYVELLNNKLLLHGLHTDVRVARAIVAAHREANIGVAGQGRESDSRFLTEIRDGHVVTEIVLLLAWSTKLSIGAALKVLNLHKTKFWEEVEKRL